MHRLHHTLWLLPPLIVAIAIVVVRVGLGQWLRTAPRIRMGIDCAMAVSLFLWSIANGCDAVAFVFVMGGDVIGGLVEFLAAIVIAWNAWRMWQRAGRLPASVIPRLHLDRADP